MSELHRSIQVSRGKVGEFKRLSAQAGEIVRTKDTGTLRYDVYFNDDQSECIVLERYRDTEALIEHLANLGDLGAAMLATSSVSGDLLGEPTSERTGRQPSPSLHAPVARGHARPPPRGTRCSPTAARSPTTAERWLAGL